MLPCYASLVLAALCGKHASAQPRLTFPIDAQLPAVAVANEIFSFAFSADTFSSQLEIDYTLGDAPSWLQLEGITRTLTGRPSNKDVGNATIQIIATDSTGTATLDTTLVVLERRTLHTRQDLFAKRISQAGRYSAPSTLLLYPHSVLHLVFGPDVFEGADDSVHFYASSGNNTPLPAWLAFDPVAVAIFGTTPPLLTPQSSPQSFAFILAASQIAGFSQSVYNFEISVTNHVLAFLQPTQTITVAAGQKVSIPPLLPQLYLDGSPLDSSKMTDTSSNQPEWLQLNSEDLSFFGVSPDNPVDTHFRLTVADDQNNVASMEIQLLMASQQNSDTAEVFLGTVNATIGKYFNHSLVNTSISSSSDTIDIDMGTAQSWLSFAQTNLTLQGSVSPDSGEGDFNVTFSLLEDGHVVEIEYLTIMLVSDDSATASANPSTTNPVSSTLPTSTIPAPGDSPNQESDDRTRNLVLMILLPILAFLVLCLAGFMLCRRSWARAGAQEATSSAPPMHQRSRNSSSGNIVVQAIPEAESLSEALFEPLPSSPPPRIDLPWPLRDRPRNKLLSTAEEHDQDSPETRSSWDDMLMEIDTPLNYGSDAGSSQQFASPSAASRLLSSSERSKSPLHGMSTILAERQLMKDSTSFATPRRFDGRQASGLGHGIGSQRMTLRQVPLSSLSKTPGLLSTSLNPYQQNKSSTTPNYNVLHPNTSFTIQGKSTRKLSLASSESRYAAPRSGSSSAQSSRPERRASSYRSSSSVYEDDAWMTEGSAGAAESSSQHSGHIIGGQSLASADIFAGREAARQWPLVPALPRAASQGVSLKSQVSGRSQGDSLRFL